MSEPMTPERVREMLEAAAPGGATWAVQEVEARDYDGAPYSRPIVVCEPSGAPDDGGDLVAQYGMTAAEAALIAAAPDLARAYLAEYERAELWRGAWSGSHDSHVRTVDEARAEIAALRERAERAEREYDQCRRDRDLVCTQLAAARDSRDRAWSEVTDAQECAADAAHFMREAERERDAAEERAERAEAEAARLREAHDDALRARLDGGGT